MDDRDPLAEAADAVAVLRGLVDAIDAGEMAATPARVWFLRGALSALDALVSGRPIDLDPPE